MNNFISHKVWCQSKSCSGECSGSSCSNCQKLKEECIELRIYVSELQHLLLAETLEAEKFRQHIDLEELK